MPVDELVQVVPLEVVVNGPMPVIASLIDEVGQCERLVAVRSAKIVGDTVTLKADGWFERNVTPPQLDLRWRSLDERLAAAGWHPNDPALTKDPAFGQLKAAVDAGRELLPHARELLKSNADLPILMTRTRKLIALKQEIAKLRGLKLLGMTDKSGAR